MDTDTNFDSDTSESWSLIDLNCEQSPDVNLTDEIGAEALESRLQEVESDEKCSALRGDKEENGSPDNIIVAENDGNVASGNDHLENQPKLKVMYDGPMFEDDSDGELYASDGYKKPYLGNGVNVEPENKDADDDTDGISVISESEFNEGKVNASESDETWDEKPSDSDANENPSSNNLRKEKAPQVSSGESSADNVNSGMAPEESCCPKDTNAENNENEIQLQRPVTPPVYRPNRNNRPGFGVRFTVAIILSGISYIILGYFCGEEDSLRTANNMAQTVRKLQKENLILHSRLTQLNRAVLARGVNKLDLKEETEPPCLKDELDCREINLKLYERNMDEGNYDFSHPRNKNSLDFSIPLNHPKNVLAFKQILVGNEVILARKTDDTFEPFNFSKYVEALVSGHYTVGTPSAPLGIDEKDTKPVELGNEKSSEPKDEEPGQKDKEPDQKDEEPDQMHEEPEGTNCITDDSIPQDDDTRKDNCLAIQEKDLSQFRWFILKDKPKCSGIKVEDLEELGSDCVYKIPMEKIYRKPNTDALEDSAAAAAETDFLEGKDDEIIPGKKASALLFDSESTRGGDNLKEKESPEKDPEFKKMKKREINTASEKRYFDHDPGSPKEKGKDEKEEIDTGYTADKYLKYFEKVEKEIRENNGRVKECVMGKDGRCELKFKEPDGNNQAQSGNYKKYVEKRQKPDRERKNNKNNKKNQALRGKKGSKAELRSKKWKTCTIKPDLKCRNDSRCDDCSCKSGDWFSKYAEGREKCRRDQKISDWQFDRAKSREYSRMGDAFWQFSRAYGRQNRRMYPYFRKKKGRYFPGKGPGSKPEWFI